jgi:hypothetical protein
MEPPVIAPVEDRLVTIRDQADRFRADADRARSRLDILTAGTHVFDRTLTQTCQIKAARDNLHRATQGLRNAEHLLRIADEVWAGDEAKPP